MEQEPSAADCTRDRWSWWVQEDEHSCLSHQAEPTIHHFIYLDNKGFKSRHAGAAQGNRLALTVQVGLKQAVVACLSRCSQRLRDSGFNFQPQDENTHSSVEALPLSSETRQRCQALQ